ncbi:MAG: septum formation initiator family protein [Oscillospiraceae bacterium]|nr:septum formation initiator family protein [Oscillospiraceae bacterium]
MPGRRRCATKKTKRAGLLTKIVILSLLIVVSISLLNLRTRLASAEAARDALQNQVNEQIQYNATLKDDIDNSRDPNVVLQVAKEKLGLVGQDEVIFFDTTD